MKYSKTFLFLCLNISIISSDELNVDWWKRRLLKLPDEEQNIKECPDLSITEDHRSLPTSEKNPGWNFNEEMMDILLEYPPGVGLLTKFVIQCELVSTRLRKSLHLAERNKTFKFQFVNDQTLYILHLDLLPSAKYNVTVEIIVVCLGITLPDKSTHMIETASSFVWTESEPSYSVNSDIRSITVTIPRVDYATLSSKVHVFLIGPTSCRNASRIDGISIGVIGLEAAQKAWHVGSFLIPPLTLSIGDHGNVSDPTNCALRACISYEIVIVISEDDIEPGKPFVWRSGLIFIAPSSTDFYQVWGLTVLLLSIICMIGLVSCLRKPKNQRKDTGNNLAVFEPVVELGRERPVSMNYRKSFLLGSTVSHHESYLTPVNEVVYEKNNRTTRVEREEFADYVKLAITTGKLDKQYSSLSTGQVKSRRRKRRCQPACGDERDKVNARDRWTVLLQEQSDDSQHKYTNAHYINGYKKDRAYIVLEGPEPLAIVEFWRLIWQERVVVICMLSDITNHERRTQYWPEVGKSTNFGDISVHNISHTSFPDYTFRVFNVKYGREMKTVHHLHYTAWPDHGIPLHSLPMVTYLKKLLATPSRFGPILVHCSVDVGRTGTIVLLDICHRRGISDNVVDVFGETKKIRRQRMNMVNSKQQYIFAHVTLVECLQSTSTAIPCDESLSITIQEHKNQLNIYQKRLDQSIFYERALQSSMPAQLELSDINIAKNRFTSSLPMTRLFIPRYPISDIDSSYISGVYVDSARHRNSYIASQHPLPSTLIDFWRMILAFNVKLIVVLQQPDIDDPTCCNFIPETDEELHPLPFFNIKGKSVKNTEPFSQQTIILTDKSIESPNKRVTTVITCKQWKPGRNKKPPSPATLVNLWQIVTRFPAMNEPIIVLCHDGVTGCGLYLALNVLLERMTYQLECDVCFAIRTVRRTRLDFCQMKDQIEYLYDAALHYAKDFHAYETVE